MVSCCISPSSVPAEVTAPSPVAARARAQASAFFRARSAFLRSLSDAVVCLNASASCWNRTSLFAGPVSGPLHRPAFQQPHARSNVYSSCSCVATINPKDRNVLPKQRQPNRHCNTRGVRVTVAHPASQAGYQGASISKHESAVLWLRGPPLFSFTRPVRPSIPTSDCLQQRKNFSIWC